MRHLEKMKTILKKCGFNPTGVDTNGKALNKILELVENGTIIRKDAEKVALLKVLKYKYTTEGV